MAASSVLTKYALNEWKHICRHKVPHSWKGLKIHLREAYVPDEDITDTHMIWLCYTSINQRCMLSMLGLFFICLNKEFCTMSCFCFQLQKCLHILSEGLQAHGMHVGSVKLIGDQVKNFLLSVFLCHHIIHRPRKGGDQILHIQKFRFGPPNSTNFKRP